MNRRAINILGPQIGCAMLACLLLVTSPMSGGQPGRPLRAQMPLLPPLGHDDDGGGHGDGGDGDGGHGDGGHGDGGHGGD